MKLFTVKQVAEMLGFSEGTIRNKISKGEIESVKVGGATRISKKHIEEYTGLKMED